MSIRAGWSSCVCLTVLLVAPCAPLRASDKKPSGDANQLRQQVQKLQREVHDRDQKIQQLQKEIQALQQQAQKGKTAVKHDESQLHQLQQQLKERDHKITQLTADLKKAQAGKVDLTQELTDLHALTREAQALRNARFVHALYLQGKSSLSAEQGRPALEEAARTLNKVPGVRAVWVGRPSGADADKDWQVGVTVLLDDEAAVRAYLKHPVQKTVADSLASTWEVKTFDYQRPEQAPPDTTKTAKTGKKDLDQAIGELRTALSEVHTLRQARGLRTLVLRLKKGAGADQVNSLLDSAPQALSGLPGVRGVWVGRATAGAGGTPEKQFQVGITVLLDDAAALSRYLNDPGQRRFLEGVRQSWDVTTYDLAP